MRSSDPNVDLLLTLRGLFYEIAVFYTKSSPKALAARRKLPIGDSYYVDLRIELAELGRNANNLERTTAVLKDHDSLRPILEILDGAVNVEWVFLPDDRTSETLDLANTSQDFQSTRSYNSYQNLHTLRQYHEQQTVERRRKLTQTDFDQVIDQFVNIHFEESKKRDRLTTHLRKLNASLVRQNRQDIAAGRSNVSKRFFQPTDETAATRRKKTAPTVGSNIRKQARRIYAILKNYWKCNGHDPHTAVQLRLYTYRKLGQDIRFDVLFCRPSVNAASESTTSLDIGAAQWLESQIKVIVEEAEPFPPQQRPSVTRPSGHKSVGWAPSKETPRTELTDSFDVSGLCSLIQKNAYTQSPRLLKLIVSNDLLKWYPATATQDVNSGQMITLADLISKPGLFGNHSLKQMKNAARRKLQFTLAHSLLQFNESPWLPKNWNKSSICFLLVEDGRGYSELIGPYLSTQCCQEASLSEQKLEQIQRVHPYPCLLALGIMLLEIELCTPIENCRVGGSPETVEDLPREYDIDDDISVARAMIEECDDMSPVAFVQAVRCCVEPEAFQEKFGRRNNFEDPEFSRAVFESIIPKLEKAVVDIRPGSLEELDDPGARIKLIGGAGSGREIPAIKKRKDASELKRMIQPKASGRTKSEKASNEDKYSQKERDDAISWFQDLTTHVHPIILPPYQLRHPITRKIFNHLDPIRVAIIDTGICLHEVATIAYEDRIKGSLTFTENDKGDSIEVEEMEDEDGHGTHAAGLVLNVAPRSEIFVARVFTKREDSSTLNTVIHDRIVRAIDHAVKKWKVDVISMSFGFEREIHCIKKAIRRAYDRDVIMFAAPNNSGKNALAAWPARHRDVIDIYATDGKGNKCSFTPPAYNKSDGFAIVGHAVESLWPEHLGDGSGSKIASGTSIATPVAAGIAAITLEYMRRLIDHRGDQIQEKDLDSYRMVHTVEGMRSIFRRMSVRSASRGEGDYTYITPWHYIGKGPNTSELQEVVLLENLLKDMRELSE